MPRYGALDTGKRTLSIFKVCTENKLRPVIYALLGARHATTVAAGSGNGSQIARGGFRFRFIWDF